MEKYAMKTLRPIFPSIGLQRKYKAELMRMVDEMTESLVYWLSAAYKKQPPRVAELAQDAMPSEFIRRVFIELAKRWSKRFSHAAEGAGEKYTKGAFKRADSAFINALRDVGWVVEFKSSPAMRDAINAATAGNVALIKSIAEAQLCKVESAVMRAYAAGGDLQSLVAEIKQTGVQSKKRAELIARDQMSKAHASANRARQLELGIEEAVWMHSSAGKEPRPEHVKANGRKYKIAEGCLIDGEYIQPGEEINCRCTSRIVLPVKF